MPKRYAVLLATGLTFAFAGPVLAQTSGHVETVVVTATPLSPSISGAAVSQSVDAADLSRFGSADALAALDRNLAGVSLTNAQGNPFQPDLFYRGFEASPLAGDAQGLAVYANGARFNQPFGDTVNFDLLPDIAVASLTLQGANPTFGLNALAGSLSATFKSGFTFAGGNAQGSFGSHGERDGEAEFGGATDSFSYYGAVRVFGDDGWRDHSPSNVRQAFADIGWRGNDTELHLWATGASNALTGNGTSPVELLAVDRSAVFTWPDTTLNRFGMLGLTAHSKLSDAFTLDAAAYLGALRQRTLNGDASEIGSCGEDDDDVTVAAEDDGLCLEDGAEVTGIDGEQIPDFLDGGPYAQLNRTATSTTASGATLQLAYAAERLNLAAGAAIDHGATAFSATSEIGALTPARGFGGPGIVIVIDGGPIAPAAITSRTTYAGLYATGAYEIADGLSLTASARYNHADTTLHDRIGTDLNGSHHYARVNPALGFVYTASPGLAFYADYSQANRTPTPAELSCADPEAPCSLTNFFVDDPHLDQVVARTVDIGARGSSQLGQGTLQWQADAYRTGLHDEILFVSSEILGRAFFRNVDSTRRQGFAASLAYTLPEVTASLGYAWTSATFETPLTLASGDNPFADDDGNIHVRPGDRMPGIPAHTVKGVVAYHPSDIWSVSIAMRAASGRTLRGDESNLNPATRAYAVFDLGARYAIAGHVELFGSIANLFDRKYETFGSFSPTVDVPISEVPGASNPRALSPAPPREFEVGLKLSL